MIDSHLFSSPRSSPPGGRDRASELSKRMAWRQTPLLHVSDVKRKMRAPEQAPESLSLCRRLETNCQLVLRPSKSTSSLRVRDGLSKPACERPELGDDDAHSIA